MAKPTDFDFYCEEALTGKTPIKKVYESETVLAFYHTKPSYKTHIVIIPKEHIHDLRTVPNDVLTEIFDVAKKILNKMSIDSNGARFITNLGNYQETPHRDLHLNQIPGYRFFPIYIFFCLFFSSYYCSPWAAGFQDFRLPGLFDNPIPSCYCQKSC